jgi:glycosyltransferase involved in cell wall biosynthesis
MVSELSILIPVYNFEVTKLVSKLRDQCLQYSQRFEICIYDDCSDEKFRVKHRPLNEFPEVRYVELRQNIGRSALRNRLAQDANYNYLLFLDNDSAIPDKQFLKRYWEFPKKCDVLIGGTIYQKQAPSDLYMLRWRYGNEREARDADERSKHPYQSLTLNNMLIRKEVFLAHPLSTDIKGYGHEDTKFGWDLQKAGVQVCHINNPVIHLGLEPAFTFLKKTEEGIKNLHQLYLHQKNIPESKLIKSYEWLKRTGMRKPFMHIIRQFLPAIFKNLKSPDPNLRHFDIYKLYLFTKLELGKKF